MTRSLMMRAPRGRPPPRSHPCRRRPSRARAARRRASRLTRRSSPMTPWTWGMFALRSSAMASGMPSARTMIQTMRWSRTKDTAWCHCVSSSCWQKMLGGGGGVGGRTGVTRRRRRRRARMRTRTSLRTKTRTRRCSRRRGQTTRVPEQSTRTKTMTCRMPRTPRRRPRRRPRPQTSPCCDSKSAGGSVPRLASARRAATPRPAPLILPGRRHPGRRVGVPGSAGRSADGPSGPEAGRGKW
mmetsp:Transcript_35996/g.107543  ORF Transcript_35996/g.107543 Transcript_35996/m.107543 type:complete len:241 (+) Transcript_35996:1204-1926(+)